MNKFFGHHIIFYSSVAAGSIAAVPEVRTMSSMIPFELAHRIGEGSLSFPVTHFDERREFEEKPYRGHIAWILQHRPAALFAAGGSGEY